MAPSTYPTPLDSDSEAGDAKLAHKRTCTSRPILVGVITGLLCGVVIGGIAGGIVYATTKS